MSGRLRLIAEPESGEFSLGTSERFSFGIYGIARATATVTLANMAYHMGRWCWLDGRSLPA